MESKPQSEWEVTGWARLTTSKKAVKHQCLNCQQKSFVNLEYLYNVIHGKKEAAPFKAPVEEKSS